jgi:hypothetical protein
MKRSATVPTVPLLASLVLSGASVSACQTQPDRDLGDSLDERSLELNPPPAPTEPFGVSPLDFVGRWEGVAEEPLAFEGVREAYAFPSGSTRFSLEIQAPASPHRPGELNGILVFGGGSPPPPAVDPELGYPSGFDYSELPYFGNRGYEGSLPPFEGYPYEVRDVYSRALITFDDADNSLVADGVLHLAFDTAELLAPWCELQQPQPTGDGMSCVKGNSRSDEDGQCSAGFSGLTPEQEAEIVAMGVSLLTEPVDCNKMFLCRQVCECDDTQCFYYPYREDGMRGELQVRRVGNTLIGVFSRALFLNERGLAVPLGTVRFTRIAEE